MSNYGKETVVLFEIDQPLCAKTYGSVTTAGTCAAVLGTTGTRKCFNTRATCQDSANYSPGTLTLRFVRPQDRMLAYGPFIPSLQSISVTPAELNLAGMEKSMAALGQREVLSVKFDDHKHSDLLVDPYRLERESGAATFGGETYKPYDRGTFWGKFIARNPYHAAYACRVRRGFVGDAIEDMSAREYVVDRIEGPNDGTVSLVAKDIFSRIEARKAVAPAPSLGELDADISAVAGSLTLSPVGIGSTYDASGYVAIGKECTAYSRVGDVLTLSTRGALGTTAAEHKQDDLVQQVLSYSAQLPHDIAYDLLVSYSSIPAAAIPKTAQWDPAAADIVELYTGHISEPTPVLDLIGEIEEQAGFTLCPDLEAGEILLRPLWATAPDTEIEDDEIIEGSFSTRRREDRRVSEVWVYYGQVAPTEKLDNRTNFHSRFVLVDEDAEDETQYDSAAIKEIFSRWIPQFGRDFSETLANRVLNMFRDPPVEATFSVPVSRVDDFTLGRYITLSTTDVQDEIGDELPTAHAVVSIEQGESEIGIKSQEVSFAVAPVGGGERVVPIENDSLNLNLRSIWNTLFAAPQSGDQIRFVVESSVTVGSNSTSVPALRTGSWPAGVLLTIEIASGGRIQGKGGRGANAAQGTNANGNYDGELAEKGGDALLVEFACTVDNDGELWAGGGAGGAGGSGDVVIGFAIIGFQGSGGGAGAGTVAEVGGRASTLTRPPPGGQGSTTVTGQDGSNSTSETGGPGGVSPTFQSRKAGDGGAGGGPGEDGQPGTSISGVFAAAGNPSSGASRGNYIVGNSLVTWSSTGDRRGGAA